MIADLKTEPSLIQAIFNADIDEVRALINRKVDVNYQNSSTRTTALHAAAHCGNSEIVSVLCSSGARVNSKNSKCFTPVHYACRSKNEADVNARDRNWQAPLHVCATYNAVNCAKLLIPLMQNIDITDRQGRSPLCHAAFSGNIQMVELLLENGANSNIRDKFERRPIHWASFVGYTDIIKLLKKYDADINCIDKEHYTPFLAACTSGKSDDTIRLLIELGSNLNSTTIFDSSAFHLACLNGHDLVVKELLNHNIEMKANQKGYHPIHYAAVSKRGAFCLELLINMNIDVSLRSADGKTPLHIAALHQNFSCAQILIYKDDSILNAQDNDKQTPLHLAAMVGNELMVSILLECGASIFIQGADGLVPFAVAALYGHNECFKDLNAILKTSEAKRKYFESKDDYDRTFLHLAAISGNAECIDLFIKFGCDVNVIDKSGNTPLHYACCGPFLTCILSLITAGANLNVANANGCTPFMYVCAYDSDGRCVRKLLNCHANAAVRDKAGYHALHYASIQGNTKAIELLLDTCKDYELYQENENKLSPLHILAYYGHRDALDIVCNEFINIDVFDVNGRTPLDLACFEGSTNCVECLLIHGANNSTHDLVNERTPIHAAAYNNNEECIRLLLLYEDCEPNANSLLINLVDKRKRTALMIAVEQGHFNTILFLIEKNAELNLMDYNNCTSLHRAAALGYEECCFILLKNNASPYIRDTCGLLPMHYAIISGHANLIHLFNEYKNDNLIDLNGFSLLHYASYFGHSTCISTLFEYGLVPKTMSYYLSISAKYSPLHFACMNGHDCCVIVLIEQYKSSIVDLSDVHGRTPLHICAINNECECAHLLMCEKCNINTLTNNCDTAIMLAAQHGSLKILELLVDDADLMRTNLQNCNCLHLALTNMHENCALYLLDKVNDSVMLNQTNSNGETPLHLAASNGYTQCVEILLSKGASIWIKNKKQQIPLLSCAKNDQVANCLEQMIMKLLQTIQINDTSLTHALLNNDVNMLTNLNSTNIDHMLSQHHHHQQHHHNEHNVCSINTLGTATLNGSLKDGSSDSEFY